MDLPLPSDIDPLLRVALQDFSFSRIDTYLSCQRKYEFSYIKQVPQPWSPHLALGSTIHSVLEECVAAETLDYTSLMNSFQQHRTKFDPHEHLPPDMLTRASAMLTDFANTHRGVDLNVLGIERYFEFVIGGGRIQGYIDRIDDSLETVNIWDYKSGKSEISGAKIKESLQLGIYGLAGKQLWPDRQIQVGMFYLSSGHRKTHVFTDEELAAVRKKVADLVFRIIHTEHFKVVYNTFVCRWCPFSKSPDHCAFGHNQLKKKGLI